MHGGNGDLGGGLTMIRGLVVLCTLACTSATAVELPRWKGHLTTLFDAQVACTDMLSPECEPFLAEAVAVADVFQAIALGHVESGNFTVVFRNMNQENCSQNWLRSMNGQGLMHVTLALPIDSDDAKNIYFTDALMRASRQLCHT
jgi:hypothetical protein